MLALHQPYRAKTFFVLRLSHFWVHGRSEQTCPSNRPLSQNFFNFRNTAYGTKKIVPFGCVSAHSCPMSHNQVQIVLRSDDQRFSDPHTPHSCHHPSNVITISLPPLSFDAWYDIAWDDRGVGRSRQDRKGSLGARLFPHEAHARNCHEKGT